jgi:hypothetical protein
MAHSVKGPCPPTGEEDVVGVGGVAVAGGDEVGHLLPHTRGAARVGVRPNCAAKHAVQLACALDGVPREHRRHGGVVQQEGGHHQGGDLAVELDGVLAQLLRVADCAAGGGASGCG